MYNTLQNIELKVHVMEYKEFLKTVLPSLGLRWRWFQRKGTKKRIIARLTELKLSSFSQYQSYVLQNEKEQRFLSGLLTVTISRFWRHSGVFHALEQTWLPTILEGMDADEPLRIWSAGCASGEEPYSLLILWQESFSDSGRELRLIASDSDTRCLERARQGRYPASSLTEMPLPLRRKYFRKENGTFSLQGDFTDRIQWIEHNLIWDPPFSGCHLIFCRNLVYTYFTEPLQQKLTHSFHASLVPSGFLVTGRKERLPASSDRLFRQRNLHFYEVLSK
jgi:chemotaxis protein methyltransferase CheR